MDELPRWTIDDLIARYELEPNLMDVFVEGEFDQEILSKCFRESDQFNRIIYEISVVSIPFPLLEQHGLTEGRKQQVIVLARELAKSPIDRGCQCLIDRDFDHWFGELESTPRLVWTEHCSLELYFFSNEILIEIVMTIANARINDWSVFFESFTEMLRLMYALRLANYELNLSMEWIPFDKYVEVEGNRVNFNLDIVRCKKFDGLVFLFS